MEEPLPLHAGEVPRSPSRLLRAARAIGLAATPRLDGIDVSQYQGVIDWQAVRGTGMAWVGIRATHSYTDSQFARNRQGASWARWRLLYDYLDPGADAGPFLRAVGAWKPGEAAMLDAEAPGLTEADCLRWCSQVEAVTGRPSVVYTGAFVSGGSIWRSSRIFNGVRARILAAYTTEGRARDIATPYGWDAWQWSSTGRVPGIGGNVDLNQVDDALAFEACAYAASTVAEPTPAEVAEAMWA